MKLTAKLNHGSSGDPIEVEGNGELSGKITARMEKPGNICHMITPAPVHTAGVKMAWQVFRMNSRGFVLLLPFGTEKIRSLKSGCSV